MSSRKSVQWGETEPRHTTIRENRLSGAEERECKLEKQKSFRKEAAMTQMPAMEREDQGWDC